MIRKWFKSLICLFVVAIFFNVSRGYAVDLENLDGSKPHHSTEVIFTPNLSSVKGPVITGRAEWGDAFERASISPWTLAGNYNWGIRDTTDTWGPNEPADSGYQYAGIPQNDIFGYAGNKNGQLISPAIDITGWDKFFLSFNYCARLEGDLFDGVQVDISPDNGATWVQIDSLALLDLNPTYDGPCVGISQIPFGTDYIYGEDTPDRLWVNVASKNLMDLGYVSAGDQVKIMFWFGSDPAAEDEGFFVDDVRIADAPANDLQPPVIEHTPLTDDTLTHTPFTITAIIFDDGFGLDTDSVYLVYNIEEGPWIYVQMTNTAGDTFEADIPGLVYHTDVYYYIEAADFATPPNIGVTAVYTFEVTNARWIIYDEDGPGFAPCAGIAPGNGLFNHFTFSDVGINKGFVHKVMLYFDSPGLFDLYIYQWNGLEPGEVLDSLMGLPAARHWITIETDDLNIIVDESVVVGYICRVSNEDTARVMFDWTVEYPLIFWGWIDDQWQHTPFILGDLMLRLKVIPHNNYIMEESGDYHSAVFGLDQAVPNPMQKNTVIEFQIPTAQNVSLRIYNVAGQLVKTLISDTKKDAGTHMIYWNGLDESGKALASGVYFYRLQGETDDMTHKLVITR